MERPDRFLDPLELQAGLNREAARQAYPNKPPHWAKATRRLVQMYFQIEQRTPTQEDADYFREHGDFPPGVLPQYREIEFDFPIRDFHIVFDREHKQYKRRSNGFKGRSVSDFIQKEIERCAKYLEAYPEHDTDREQNKWYHLIQDWLLYLADKKRLLDDPTYSIDEKFFGGGHYSKTEKQILQNGHCLYIRNGQPVRVYNPYLARLFDAGEIQAYNQHTGETETISGRTYLNAYVEGYREGQRDFEKEFPNASGTLIGDKPEALVQALHFNYEHREFNHYRGWKAWGNIHTTTPTAKGIREIGYYCGKASSVEELTEQFKSVFERYWHCPECAPAETGQAVQETATTPASLITLTLSPSQLTELIEGAKPYFNESDHERLERALKGEAIEGKITFLYNQNKWGELFRRLKYHSFIAESKTDIAKWICATFNWLDTKAGRNEVKEFKFTTVNNLLSKASGEAGRGERICLFDWLPYKTPDTLKREAEKEKMQINHSPNIVWTMFGT